MLQPGRHANTSDYRYGFQGQEMDDEVKGEGNSLNYTFRMHDPRVGRFFAVDPLEPRYPMLTPYQFGANTPIMAVELEGLESSDDPNLTQQPLDGSQSGDLVLIPDGGIPLEAVTIFAAKRVESNYDTREEDQKYWTSEVNQNDVSMTFEQWKVIYGNPQEDYQTAKNRYQNEYGSFWKSKNDEWDKKAKEDVLAQKLWFFTGAFSSIGQVVAPSGFGGPINGINYRGPTPRQFSLQNAVIRNLSNSSDEITLFRNFGPNEYASFRANGNKFSLKSEGFGRKQFWLDQEGLDFWRSNPKFSKEFTIKIRVPKSLLKYERTLDGYRAIDVGKTELPLLNQNFKIDWIEIRPGG